MVNYTNWTLPTSGNGNVTSMSSLVKWANTTSGGYLGFGFLLVIFTICFLSFSTSKSIRVSFGASMFITTILGGMMRGLGLVTDSAMILLIVLAVAGGVWLVFGED